MKDQIESALAQLAKLIRDVKSVKTAQLFSTAIRSRILSFAENYFHELKPTLSKFYAMEGVLEAADKSFHELLVLSRRNASKDKCVRALQSCRNELVRAERAAITEGSKGTSRLKDATDQLIVDSLNDICPLAALSYQQALLDLMSHDRLSYRGPATDLREALRETLDKLAPDKEVEEMPGYKLEADAKRPTMKQKVRFILRSRGLSSGQIVAPESAVTGIEDLIGGIVRSVYTRSSVSTHVSSSREEVLRIHSWVRMVFCDLLEIRS